MAKPAVSAISGIKSNRSTFPLHPLRENLFRSAAPGRPTNGTRKGRSNRQTSCEGVGVRATARLTDCQHKTVLAVLNTVGAKCAAFLDRIVRNIQTESFKLTNFGAGLGLANGARHQPTNNGAINTPIWPYSPRKFIVATTRQTEL